MASPENKRGFTVLENKFVLSVKEAAKVLGIHENTLRRRIADGSIPSRKLGARILIPVSALRAWLVADDNKTPGGTGGK